MKHWFFSLEFCHEPSKTGMILIRNPISVSTSFDSSAFLIDKYWSFLLMLFSFFSNSMTTNLFTASLIFTSHSKAQIKESPQLWTWFSKICSSSPRDSSILNRSCCQCQLLLHNRGSNTIIYFSKFIMSYSWLGKPMPLTPLKFGESHLTSCPLHHWKLVEIPLMNEMLLCISSHARHGYQLVQY